MSHFLRRFLALLILLGAFTGCQKSRFFEDPDNPGLSRFTSRGYDVTSAYINDRAWVSGFSAWSGPAPTQVYLDTSTTPKDTLYIQWEGGFTDYSSWRYITIAMPVRKGFSLNDFLNWNGKTFPQDSTTVTISLSDYAQLRSDTGFSGKGKIYFVRIEPQGNNQNKGFHFSGLFEGTIHDTLIISKGRFDYSVPSRYHNLH